MIESSCAYCGVMLTWSELFQEWHGGYSGELNVCPRHVGGHVALTVTQGDYVATYDRHPHGDGYTATCAGEFIGRGPDWPSARRAANLHAWSKGQPLPWPVPAAITSNRFTPADSKGDAWDTKGRTL